MEEKRIALFHGGRIRKISFRNEWWFSVIDVVEVLTGNARPRKYWNDLKKKLTEEGYTEVSENIGQLKMQAADGKFYLTDCANTETLFRIIQSIPSPKVEPLKRWLARVGKERIDEIENPEIAMDRMKEIYEKKGYPKGWIDKRMRGIAVRKGLTDEWNMRGAQLDIEYAILTNDIMKGTFNKSVERYKRYKGLQRENLRDHMNDLELILTMLGEATTTRLHKDRNSAGFPSLRNDAKNGGAVAGRTRKDIERQTGKKVVSSENYLDLSGDKRIE